MINKLPFLLTLIGLSCVLLLTACQGRYASLNSTMSQCGFMKASYKDFHDCMDQSLPPPQRGAQDYYAQTAQDIRNELNFCADQLASKKMKQKDAYEYFSAYVNQKNLEEQKSAQIAGAVVGIAVLGVAAGSCYNAGGCYSSGYQNSHQGCCSWHGGISHCGGTHLVCNDGWTSGCAC